MNDDFGAIPHDVDFSLNVGWKMVNIYRVMLI